MCRYGRVGAEVVQAADGGSTSSPRPSFRTTNRTAAPTATPAVVLSAPATAAARKNETPLSTSLKMRMIGHPTAATGMTSQPRRNRPATVPRTNSVGITH